MQNVVGSDTAVRQLALLTEIKTLLTGGTLHLFKESFSPNVNSTLADFIAAEADYTGYAAVVLTWGANALDADGGYVSQSSRAFFQCTTDTADNVIGGAWLQIEGTPDVLWEYFTFPIAVNLSTALTYLAAVIGLREPNPDTGIFES